MIIQCMHDKPKYSVCNAGELTSKYRTMNLQQVYFQWL